MCAITPEALAAGYERAANLERCIKDAYIEKRVTPRWIGQSGVFWYRMDIASGPASFIFVDPKRGIRRPAFDHKKLLEALLKRDADADANTFPFNWIDPSEDGEYVRFRMEDSIWQFRDDGTLAKYDGEIREETLKPLDEEVPSDPYGSDCDESDSRITFINKTNGPIALSWIDYDGNAEYYETVEAGKEGRMSTYVGHVWRVSKSEGGEPIANFKAEHNDLVATIEGGMDSSRKPVEKPTADEHSGKIYGALSDSEGSEEKQRSCKVLVRDHNVWVCDTDGQETQLSTNGTSENPYDKSRVYQSSNSRFAVVWQYTPEQDHKVYQVESSPKDQIQPRLKEFQYLKPGDKVRIDKPKMFDLVEKKEVVTDESLFQNPYKIRNIDWSPNGQEYHFQYNDRTHQVVRVIGINTEGRARLLVEESSKTFVDYSSKGYFHRVDDSDELIWASERDGRNHLYLFDLEKGTLQNRITEGKWVVRSVDRIDAKNRQMWFKVFGAVQDQDPYYAQLARVNLDGSGFTLLTSADGTHTWKWSPDRKYLIDTWSRVDLPPKTVLRDADTGKELIELETNSIEKLSQADWTTTERFHAPGRDGETMIYGIIVKPSVFDTNKKYPVIENIYAGPTDFDVPKAFSPLLRAHQLAELGFIVVQIDGMGTNWRSKAFLDHCFKNLKDAGFPDRIAWMKDASESRPWMDLSRVGIYGGSAGGQNAMSAMLWHGDFYKAAVADCGCHDNRMDKIGWNERYMGWPVNSAYEDCSNVVHAERLAGALMLIVSELDDNVDPASTMQVVNALNGAGKDYDLLFLPGAGHCAGTNSKYAIRRQRDFFVRHLIGIEPPKRNGK